MDNNFQPQPQDLAMDAFRGAFNIPLTTHVIKDGKLMRIRVTNSERADEYLALAQTIILINHLPLAVGINEWQIGNCIFDRWIVVEFDQTKLVPEAY